MINTADILETIHMIREENLDIRTVTMGISLYDCVSDDIDRLCANVYDKIMSSAKNLVSCCEGIEKLYGIPIVNKRVSVTPYKNGRIEGGFSPKKIRDLRSSPDVPHAYIIVYETGDGTEAVLFDASARMVENIRMQVPSVTVLSDGLPE